MALLSVPFASIYLVPHVSGGAIAHVAGGYVANTFVPAAVVEAFGVASGVLAQVGGSVTAVASAAGSNPLVLGTVAIAAVAVGTYCYFHGIPAPIEAALTKAGLGTATKHGLMVSLPKLAVALIMLGGAGYLAYRFYSSRRSERMARILNGRVHDQTPDEAEAVVQASFGKMAWTEFGATLWSSAAELGKKSTNAAKRSFRSGAARADWISRSARHLSSHASDALKNAAESAAVLASSAADLGISTAQASTQAARDGSRRTGQLFSRLTARFRRPVRPA